MAFVLFSAYAWAQLPPEPDPLLPDAILYPGSKPGLIMVVFKSTQTMLVYAHDGQGRVWLLKELPCSTGVNHGDKLLRGDKKTPEGYYIFRQKLLPEELPDIYGILAFPMDYPNFWDQKNGRGGDGIWTHGINKPLINFDSNGCIELLNHDLAAMEVDIRLYDTPILIYDAPKMTSVATLREQAKQAASFVDSWRVAWENKDHAAYAQKYDKNFVNSDALSYKRWMERKKRVASNYKTIRVTFTDVKIFKHRDTILVSCTQTYQGDKRFTSVGYKRLFLKPNAEGDLVIVGEEYGPLPKVPPEKWLSAEERQRALTTPPIAVAQMLAPTASASAGVILPFEVPSTKEKTSLLYAKQEDQAQAAADEAARSALETRSLSQSKELILEAQNGAAANASLDDSLSPNGQDAPLSEPQNPLKTESDIDTNAESLSQNEQVATVQENLEPSAQSSASDQSPQTTQDTPQQSPHETPKVPEVESQSTEERTPEDQAVSVPAEPSINPQESQIKDSKPQETPSQTNSQNNDQSAQPSTNEGSEVMVYTENNQGAFDLGPQATAQAAEELLSGWLRAWELKNEEDYFAYYHPDFYFLDQKLHLKSFRSYRSRMMKQSGPIEVSASQIEVQLAGEKATLRFIQTYSSQKTTDRGLKTLGLVAKDGKWKIISETFKPLP
jgi:murein L,D-transpeptidase YafK